MAKDPQCQLGGSLLGACRPAANDFLALGACRPAADDLLARSHRGGYASVQQSDGNLQRDDQPGYPTGSISSRSPLLQVPVTPRSFATSPGSSSPGRCVSASGLPASVGWQGNVQRLNPSRIISVESDQLDPSAYEVTPSSGKLAFRPNSVSSPAQVHGSASPGREGEHVNESASHERLSSVPMLLPPTVGASCSAVHKNAHSNGAATALASFAGRSIDSDGSNFKSSQWSSGSTAGHARQVFAEDHGAFLEEQFQMQRLRDTQSCRVEDLSLHRISEASTPAPSALPSATSLQGALGPPSFPGGAPAPASWSAQSLLSSGLGLWK
eukprot:TRINITY_DN106101_c0_g1_i1.p1 TRINITY_DN106101_c0_g1~~TRINITY_DN106101_c0_g1_i1.p1  ORF type:complete len:335 (+),score=46.82 TRINITY_DN106101_c0_g1_i1:28-1005(+)